MVEEDRSDDRDVAQHRERRLVQVHAALPAIVPAEEDRQVCAQERKHEADRYLVLLEREAGERHDQRHRHADERGQRQPDQHVPADVCAHEARQRREHNRAVEREVDHAGALGDGLPMLARIKGVAKRTMDARLAISSSPIA
ncbi:MAG: hypothetical protein M5R40_08575 [Anaerolineae bacterium]|nr:hypothetical protein [Anaerolineae bacterium]